MLWGFFDFNFSFFLLLLVWQQSLDPWAWIFLYIELIPSEGLVYETTHHMVIIHISLLLSFFSQKFTLSSFLRQPSTKVNLPSWRNQDLNMVQNKNTNICLPAKNVVTQMWGQKKKKNYWQYTTAVSGVFFIHFLHHNKKIIRSQRCCSFYVLSVLEELDQLDQLWTEEIFHSPPLKNVE